MLDQTEFTENPGIDIALGRAPEGVGDFQVLSSTTKDQPNSGAKPIPTLIPTQTPIPTRTPTPTKIPTPTKVPTPTKISVPTKIPTLMRSDSRSVEDDSDIFSDSNNINTEYKAGIKALSSKSTKLSNKSMPTAVLGMNKKLKNPSPSKTKDIKDTKVKGVSTVNNFSNYYAISAVGAIFLVSCAIILALKKYRQSKQV